MKRLHLLICGILLARIGEPLPAAESDWKLVWQDEFDGSALDLGKWSYDLGQGQNGWGNGEWQVYTDSTRNIWLQNGLLNVKAERQFTGYGGYTSARISTKNKAQFQYGRIAARIKLPRGRAVWPAFWMMGATSDLETWPFCGEVDIMEMRGGDAASYPNGDGGDKKIYGSVHYFHSKAPGHVGWGEVATLDRPFADDFHIFEIEWYDTRIIYKLDGKQYAMAQYNGVNEMHEFRAWPYYLLLQVAVGGPGTDFTAHLPPDDSVFPQTMQVDWVRVYQKNETVKPPKTYEPAGTAFNISNENLSAGAPLFKGKIDVWNPNGFSIQKAIPAAEGQEAITLRSDGSQGWFGIGYSSGQKVDLGGYRYLSLSLKTTSKAAFKIGPNSSYGSWVYFVSGSDPYGFKRDGQWHTVHIPIRDFLQPEYDWGHVDIPFALVASGINQPTEISIDGIVYDGRSENPDDYLLIPESPQYYLEDDDRLGAVDELDGDMQEQVWNYLGFDKQEIQDCVRGSKCQRILADGKGNWFGLAYAGLSPTKLLNYNRLEFSIRTASTGKLKIGISDVLGKDAWLDMNGPDVRLVRNGQWQQISIPLSAFSGVDLQALRSVMTIIGEEAKPYQIDLDAMRLSQ